MALILALDFGGTKHSVALIEHGQHHWLAHRRVFSPSQPDAGYDLHTVTRTAADLLGDQRPDAIGVSFGGPADYDTGIVRLSHHVPGWENTPLQRLLEERFDAPARVDNDANVAALGEQRHGAGQGVDSLLYVTVSTGVGSGIILNGRIWRGHERMAGELGHTVVDPGGPACLCGKRGCVERFASGTYIAYDVRQVLANNPEQKSIVLDLAKGDLRAIDGKLISAAAAAGDPLAIDRLKQAAWALGLGVGNAMNLLNLPRVVLGGGVTKSGPLFWETLRQTVAATTLPEIHVDVLPAAQTDDAPLWGAVALVEDLV